MLKHINISGQKFNKLFVLEKVKARNKSSAFYLCLCECGNKSIISGALLRKGIQKSCGCYRRYMLYNGITHKKHGFANKTSTYKSWKEMRFRCLSNKSHVWKNWGGRGIIICQRWLDDFENFLADMGERPLGTSLDRINVNGNYEPSNCRWADVKTQGRNQRFFTLNMEKAKIIKKRFLNGESPTKLAKEYGISRPHVYKVAKGIVWG